MKSPMFSHVHRTFHIDFTNGRGKFHPTSPHFSHGNVAVPWRRAVLHAPELLWHREVDPGAGQDGQELNAELLPNGGSHGKPWEDHGKTMGKPQNHRKTMGKPWENHGKTMGKPWEFQDPQMEVPSIYQAYVFRAYVRGYTANFYGQTYGTVSSILGSWNSRRRGGWMVAKSQSPVDTVGGTHPILSRVSSIPLVQDFASILFPDKAMWGFPKMRVPPNGWFLLGKFPI